MRPVKEQATALSIPEGSGTRPAQLGVSAQPVSRVSAPAPYDEGQDIARALSGLNPSLHRFLESRGAVNGDEQAAQGARARAMQGESSAVPMTPEQDPYWQQGYMKMHGLMVGSQDATAMEEEFQKQKDDPNFDVNSFLAQHREANLKGMTDKDALAGYLPRMTSSVTKIQEEYSKQVVMKARDDKNTAINTMIADHQNTLGDLTHVEAATQFQGLQDRAYELGVPRKEFTSRYIASIVSNPHAGPYDFDFLNAPGRDGVVPANTDGPGGLPWSATIEKARDAAYKRQEAELTKTIGAANTQTALWEAQTLKSDPMSIQDPFAYIKSQTTADGLYSHPGAAAAAYERITKRQDEWKHQQFINQAINGMSPLPRAQAAQPEVKAAIEDKYLGMWAQVNPADPASLASMITKSTQMHELYGVEDPHIKAVASSVSSMGTAVDPKGNIGLTPEFRAAYALWTGLRQSDNPQLSSFDEKSSMLLHTYSSLLQAGTPEVEAFKTAKLNLGDEAKQRRAQMFQPGEEAAARKGVSDYFNSARAFNGNGFWPNVQNKDDIANRVIELARTYAGTGQISKDDAIAMAQDKIKSTYAYDGHSIMAPIPPDLGKEKGMQYLSLLAEEAKTSWAAAHNGDPIGHYEIRYRTVNGENVFSLTDPIGTPLIPPRSVAQLDQMYLQSIKSTPEQIAAKNAQVAANPGFTGFMLDLQRKAQSGEISSVQYREAFAQQQREQAAKRNAEAHSLVGTLNAVPQFPAPQAKVPNLRTPVATPTGVEQSTKEISLSNASASPAFALTTYGEGFRNSVYRDTKGLRTLGFGYNLDARKPEDVKRDLAASGVTDPARLERVIAGKESITPDEGQRLYQRVIGSYQTIAKEMVGDGVWNALPENRKAVLTDIAYNAGGNRTVFGGVVDALKAGDIDGAASKVTGLSKRRVNLQLAMWQSPEHFKQLVQQGI